MPGEFPPQLASSATKLMMSASMVMQVRGKDAMVLASNDVADMTLSPQRNRNRRNADHRLYARG